jgi:hypothetical protein
MTVTVFTLLWLAVSVVGVGVYAWDRREAMLDGQYLNEPPPGTTERRVRPQVHIIVQGDVHAASLYLIGQIGAFLVGVLSLWTPSPNASTGLTLRGFVLIVGFIVLEAMTSAGGVVRIYVRRWLRRRHATEVAAAHIPDVNPLPAAIMDKINREIEGGPKA